MSNFFTDADGNRIGFNFNTVLGRVAAAVSRSFALCNEDNALLSAAKTNLDTLVTAAQSTAPSPIIMSVPYQAVAISQTAKVLGATGAIGDTLSGIVIQPTGTTVGSVIVYDNVTAVYTYPGGTVGADLRPIVVGMGMTCVGAGWHVTTPANATVLALGKFS